MFGSDKGSVIVQRKCPRCNADAVTRGMLKKDTEIILCHITCDKCHLIRFIGFTTVSACKHAAVIRKLTEAANVAENETLKKKILDRIEILEGRKRLYELGL